MISTIILWIVIAAFALIGVLHLIGGDSIKAAYRTWNYPKQFHLVTGVLEAIAAGLLAMPQTRLIGICLGTAICLAAIVTLLWHRQFSHLVGPLPLIAAIAYLYFG